MVKTKLRRPIPLPKRTQCVSLQGVLRRPIEDQRRKQHRGFEWAQGVLVSLAHPRRLRHPNVIPSVFIQYSSEEDMGDWSKSNGGQVDVVRQVLKLLSTPKNPTEQEDSKESEAKLKTVTVFSPYTNLQVQALRQRLPSSITSSTIDSFQGRESDIIIFSTVRCNVDGMLGFWTIRGD